MKGMTVVFEVHKLCCRPPLPSPPQPIRSLQRFRSSFPFTALWRPYLTSNKSERGDYSSLSTLYQGHATQCIDQVTLLIPGAWKRQSVPNNTTQTDRLVVSPPSSRARRLSSLLCRISLPIITPTATRR